MSKAAKRERQRLNREARREAEIAVAKRRRQLKTARNVGLLLLPLVALFVGLQVFRDNDKAAATACDEVSAPAPKDPPFTAPPVNEIDPAVLYTATLDTSCGKIELLLDAAQAPTTVNNFVFLARQGFYDGLGFHRVAEDFVVQAGDPVGDGSGGPGYSFVGEVPSEVTRYDVGSVAMAKGPSEPAGTAGSQFFIVTSQPTAPDRGLDVLNQPPYQYAIVGKLAEGNSLKIAQKIESLAPPGVDGQPGDGPPTETVIIKKVTITEMPSTAATSAPPSS